MSSSDDDAPLAARKLKVAIKKENEGAASIAKEDGSAAVVKKEAPANGKKESPVVVKEESAAAVKNETSAGKKAAAAAVKKETPAEKKAAAAVVKKETPTEKKAAAAAVKKETPAGKKAAAAVVKKETPAEKKEAAAVVKKEAAAVVKKEAAAVVKKEAAAVVKKEAKDAAAAPAVVRVKKEYVMQGQIRDTPPDNCPLKRFYTTLYEQKPNSEIAKKWLMQSGLLSAEATEAYLKAVGKLKLKSPTKPAPSKSPTKPAPPKSPTKSAPPKRTAAKSSTVVKKEAKYAAPAAKMESKSAAPAAKKDAKKAPPPSNDRPKKKIKYEDFESEASDSGEESDFDALNMVQSNTSLGSQRASAWFSTLPLGSPSGHSIMVPATLPWVPSGPHRVHYTFPLGSHPGPQPG
eukprot:gene20887-27739_t